MSKTRHIQKRMNQRAIRESLLSLVAEFGVESGDKIVLNRKGAESVLQQLEAMKKSLLEVHKKGGLIVVEAGNRLVTTYQLNSYQR